MSTRILCLNVLALISTVYPVSLPQIALTATKRTPAAKSGGDIYLALCAGVCLLLLLLCAPIVPWWDGLRLAVKPLWFLAAAAAGLAFIGIEYLAGAALLRASGVKARGISINAGWKKASAAGFILTLIAAVFEELIFRQLWGVVILTELGMSPVWFIVLSSIAYGVNHLYYGFHTFIQKTLTGALLSLLFLAGGRAVIIPITAHLVQNAAVLLMGRRLK